MKKNEKKGEIEICIYIRAGVGRAGVWERVRETHPEHQRQSLIRFIFDHKIFSFLNRRRKRGNRKISIFEIIF